MIFASYLLVLALTLLHSIEAFAPWLAVYRPVLILSLLVLGFSVAQAVVSGRFAAQPRHAILFGGFIATIALSLIASGWAGGAIEAMFEFGSSAVLAITTVLVVTTTRRLRITTGVFALCLIALAVAGIAAYRTGFMVDRLVVQQGVSEDDYLSPETETTIPADDTSGDTLWRIRSWGFLSDPNDFAQAMVATLPLLAALWIRRRRVNNLIRFWLPVALLLYAIYLTHSRGALLGLAAVILVGMLRNAGVVRTGLLIGAMAAGAAFLGFSGGRGYSSGEESAGERIAAWGEGIHMVSSHPLLGVGYGNFTDYFERTAHNSFVLCFSELGLTGYFFWLGMLVLAFKELRLAIAAAPAGSDEERWARMLRLSMIGFLVCAWFLSRTYQPVLYVLLALCFASCYCAHRAEGAAEPRWRAPPGWIGTTIKLMIASIALIYLIVRFQNAFVR